MHWLLSALYVRVCVCVKVLSVARAIPDSDETPASSVTELLQSVGLAEYCSGFAARGMSSVDELRMLSGSDLQSLGVTDRLHVDLLLAAVDCAGGGRVAPAARALHSQHRTQGRTLHNAAVAGSGGVQSTAVCDQRAHTLHSPSSTVVDHV